MVERCECRHYKNSGEQETVPKIVFTDLNEKENKEKCKVLSRGFQALSNDAINTDLITVV